MKKLFLGLSLCVCSLIWTPTIYATNYEISASQQQSGNIIKTTAFELGDEYGKNVQIRMSSDSYGRYFTVISVHGMKCDPIIVTKTKNNRYFSHSFVYGSVTYYLNLDI